MLTSTTSTVAAVERLAVATFVRLWDALDRRLFTSDPSPWNVLVHQSNAMPGSQPVATIIDLHGLEDEVGFALVQRLAAVYGMRQDILEDVLIPGVLDALGGTAGQLSYALRCPSSKLRPNACDRISASMCSSLSSNSSARWPDLSGAAGTRSRTSLIPQRLDRIELRCFAGRIKTEKDAYRP